ncbi:hypothetical protein AB0C29_11975 [Actinoplanes sp. NPDC048791]|uniref:Uncharacterized protein n=1 Tax=Actinoplanes auranticolor TaxID=47988 RepID=A0A919SJ44_9ACTN|nr:hypothetical protein [Actinoplanes auranticolor]GIM72991.1 hypothetical protein Aau02nite_53730 [Actinoplanes auranticolor]
MGADNKMPGTSVAEGHATQKPGRESSIKEGHLPVSELIADRPAAPSPFGDDQEFPLPVDQLTYTPTTTP